MTSLYKYYATDDATRIQMGSGGMGQNFDEDINMAIASVHLVR